MANFDLTKLLPKRYRDKTIDTLVKSLFNQHLSKDDSRPLFGYVGTSTNVNEVNSQDIYLTERDLERQINQLEPIVYAKHASEEKTIAWADLVQKLVLMGVPYDQISTWLTTDSFNLVPPIDLDKFVNYNEYYWIGEWIVQAPSLPYYDLGISYTDTVASMVRSNVSMIPEYYVMQRGSLDSLHNPIQENPSVTTWSDWSFNNLWVHKDDMLAFQAQHPVSIGGIQLQNAKLPIIEYFNSLKLNTFVQGNEPSDIGTARTNLKTQPNQPPMFDLYTHDGVHSKLTSCIFYFKESSDQVVDSRIGRRIILDSNADFVFSLGTSLPGSNELLWFKEWSALHGAFELRSVWRGSDTSTAKYLKYNTSGTIINHDKFVNFKDYFWTGVTQNVSLQPSYNQAGNPEYYVIETGGTSLWSQDNKWAHVSTIQRADLSLYIQANKPIIEFNKELEIELRDPKLRFNQVPRFKLYEYNQSTRSYVETSFNDPYTHGCLLARLSDLPSTKAAIIQSSDLTSKLFDYGGETYVQSFVNGTFVNSTNGIVYGFTTSEVSRSSVGDGQVVVSSTADNALVQVYTLTAIDATHLNVTGSILGALPTLTLGTPYSTYGSTFTLIAGTIPFVAGDTITLTVKSVLYTPINLYTKINNNFKTFTNPSDILSKDTTSSNLVDASTSLKNGVWAVPDQFKYNPMNETRSTISQGDLVYHFASIMEAQYGIMGSVYGGNNWRNLSFVNHGLGGKVKQFNSRFNLLIGLLMQEGVTPVGLLDFSRTSYERMLNQVREFVEQEFVNKVVTGSVSIPNTGGVFTDAIKQILIDYLEHKSTVVSSSVTKLDDIIGNAFFDSTLPIKGSTATLPYLGLVSPVQPQITLDLEQNMNVLVHHDGHRTQVPIVESDILKKLVLLKFKRSNGQESAGIISGPTPPSKPFAKQLWMDLSSTSLYIYNVASDQGVLQNAVIGSYSYNRTTGEVWQFNGVWNLLGSDSVTQALPWVKLDFSSILQSAILAVENDLYVNCPPVAIRTNVNTSSITFKNMMKKAFESFAAAHNIIDPYASIYDVTNPFTFNYIGTTSSYFGSTLSSWQQIYLAVYGTSRPDLQPWIPAGYPSEAAMLADLIGNNLIPTGTTSFNVSMWNSVATFIRTKYVANGKPNLLSVDVITGSLIAPFANGNTEQLLSTAPPTPQARYIFGSLGPIELMWTRTSDYLAAYSKSIFLVDPLSFVNDCWGDVVKRVNGYELIQSAGRKVTPNDVSLHGSPLNKALVSDQIVITGVTPDLYTRSITFEIASPIDKLVKIINGSIISFHGYSNIVTDLFTASIIDPKAGFNIGDTFIVTVSDLGVVSVVATPASVLKLEGLSQLYIHAHRYFGSDIQLVSNKSWLTQWQNKLGYRLGTFVDTDSFKIKVNDFALDTASYKVVLKETQYTNKINISALNISVLQVGTQERIGNKMIPAKPYNGQRGDDWIFRVDSFLPSTTNLEWYQLDTASEYNTFYALNKKSSSDAWKEYTHKVQLRTTKAPFMVKGIQNLLNFVFGYVARLNDIGFDLSGLENQPTDPITNRVIGWQLQIEQFIDNMFNDAVAGELITLNPFANKLLVTTPFGFVANLAVNNTVLGDLSPKLLNQNSLPINSDQYRVFRNEDKTEIVFDTPVYAASILVNTHEHLVVFEDYAGLNTLVYDAFLGQKLNRIFVEGNCQSTTNGRISYGGKYFMGGNIRSNMEASVQNILKLYDGNDQQMNRDDIARARSTISYEPKDYWVDRNDTAQTEFKFWQGVVKGKGTNFAVDAFTNSKSYQSASLDECWAYKIAEYGDARKNTDVELRVIPNDCMGEYSNYLFIESDETTYLGSWVTNNQYDVAGFDSIPFDANTIYTPDQFTNMEYVDPNNTIFIKGTDESRWVRYSDLNTLTYIPADIIDTVLVTPTSIDDIYTLRKGDGSLVNADSFEVIDVLAVQSTPNIIGQDTLKRYYEAGNYIAGTNPPEYDTPKFTRINSSNIQFLDTSLLNKPMKVVCYGPPLTQYSPSQLFNYLDQDVEVNGRLIWYDPARGVHDPLAIAAIDYDNTVDPASYNTSMRTKNNRANDSYRAWGKNESGKVWWNKNNLSWVPYSDVKRFPNINERLARWGGLANDSTINVYEWVESPVPPSEYSSLVSSGKATGEIAIVEHLSCTRSWQHRPVVWLKTNSPTIEPREAKAYQTGALTPLTLNGNNYLVIDSGYPLPTFNLGDKVFAVTYLSNSKIKSEVLKPYGQYNIISEKKQYIAGSSLTNDTPLFNTISPNLNFTNFSITVDNEVATQNNVPIGPLHFVAEVVAGEGFLSCYISNTTVFQRIQVGDTPIEANTMFSLNFDQLGISINLKNKYSRTEWWEVSAGVFAPTSNILRTSMLVLGIIDHGYNIVIREAFQVYEQITPVINGAPLLKLPGNTDSGNIGWVLSEEPQNLTMDNLPPYNHYSVLYGDYEDVGGKLAYLKDQITSDQQNPKTLPDGTIINIFNKIIQPWELVTDEIKQVVYFRTPLVSHTQFENTYLTFDSYKKDVKVYINGVKTNKYIIEYNGVLTSTVRIDNGVLSMGDDIKLVAKAYTPTEAELALSPYSINTNPTITKFYAIDTPYSKYVDYNEYGNITNTRYYYWVKNKELAPFGKTLSVKQITNMLNNYNDIYCIPQVMKFFNQLDGRQNRYAMLSVANLAKYVRNSKNYKLRIKGINTMRNDDKNISLKNKHEEWTLIRQHQNTKIPKELWDVLVDSMCGESSTGQPLPFSAYSNYDSRNPLSPSSKYGVSKGQVMTDPSIAKSTVKSTLLNTSVTKYNVVSGVSEVDPVSFTGFDLNQLDVYFSNNISIRETMGSIWVNAKPKQINELFFAVLNDTLTKTKELSGIFKTSFVSLNDVRTVANNPLGVNQ